jgi:hypothetical protein
MRFGLTALAASIALFGATPMIAMAETVPAQDAAAKPVSLDGTWQGTIHFDKEAFIAETSTPAAGRRFRIEIHDVVVRVFFEEDGAFKEVKPGMFHIAPVSASAVIFATEESEGNWVESWAFVITAKTKDLMIVNYTRLVNNVSVPHGEKESEFATRGAGEFARVTP